MFAGSSEKATKKRKLVTVGIAVVAALSIGGVGAANAATVNVHSNLHTTAVSKNEVKTLHVSTPSIPSIKLPAINTAGATGSVSSTHQVTNISNDTSGSITVNNSASNTAKS